MANNILVFIEQRNGEVKKASLEAVAAAKKLSKAFGSEIKTAAIGNEITGLEKAAQQGAASIVHLKSAELDNYSTSAYADLLKSYIDENDIEIVIFANTAMGKDLAPILASKMDAGIATDCTELKVDGDSVIVTRPVYAGKALVDVKFKSSKKVITIRPNTFPLGEPVQSTVEIKVMEQSNLNLSSKVVEVKKSGGKIDVAEAEIIVSGGRGLKESENFKLVEELANVLGAAVGASRAVVDAGWRSHSEQVGQTGKTVSPNLYIALGISGAIQHLAGMRSSKYIVAINKDKDAPIFQIADYGIAGDVFEIVPKLIEEIKKIKEN